MAGTISYLVLILTTIYFGIGMVFSVFFLMKGAGAVDPVAQVTPLRTRVLFVPGAAAVWPVLVIKWLRAGRSA